VTQVTIARPGPGYAFGHSEDEQRRLDRQGAVLRAATERWLREAGLGTGMRVLDVGCGTGDLTRLAAALVGPAGRVLGVDRAPEVVATARRSAAARGLANVEIVEADINDFEPGDVFDALIGRLVLMYQPDPAATVRHLVRFVNPGGIVAFADYSFLPPTSSPPRPLFDQVYSWVVSTIRRGTPNADLGMRLHRVFTDAGLPAPTVRFEVTAGVGGDLVFEEMPVDVLRSLLPLAERLGITSAAEVDIETLQERMNAEAATANGVAFGPVFATAATRLLA
jgi:SAM-dependent methyltransferase